MPTIKTVYWLIAASVLYLIAWNTGSGWLYTLTALTAAVPLASLFLSRSNIRSIDIQQNSPLSATHGESILAPFIFVNRSRLPAFVIKFNGRYGEATANGVVTYIKGRQKQNTPLKFGKVVRGVYPGVEITLSSGAPAGLSKRKRRLLTGGPLVVYPRWQRLVNDWGSGQRNAGYMVSSAIPARSPGSDYLGVRDYRPEDTPRSIHWRTSARSGNLAVIEYSRQAAITPVVLLDTFIDANIGEGEESTFESAVTIAASLIQRESGHNRRFGLGSSPAHAAENGFGVHADSAMLWLASVTAGSDKIINLEEETLVWPEAIPVLILTSHKQYINIDNSNFLSTFPHSIVIMLDGRGFSSGKNKKNILMVDDELKSLSRTIECGGGSFRLIKSRQEVRPCLEAL